MYGVKLCWISAYSSSSCAHWMTFCTAQVPFLCVLCGVVGKLLKRKRRKNGDAPNWSEVRRDALEHSLADRRRRLLEELWR